MKRHPLAALTIALATGDAEGARPLLSEEAEWEMVGRGTITGRTAILAALAQARPGTTVTIARVLTEGRSGLVEGTIALSPTHLRRFCDLYDLQGASGETVRRITSYDIRV